ncbi:MAG TPA: ATP-binding cassette domain-containing protein [Gemmatimonadales bacterium]|nr:ATP-binding cassette domain-containing protein [Gemmatimonadales bacterium]
MTAPALELEGIEKRFGPVQALHGADFALAAGEVHALLGENGAGKSTLMHVAYGLVRPDAGAVRVRGCPASLGSPRDARRLGIGMVHQHFTSIPALTVAENVALTAGWPVTPRALRARVAALAGRAGLPLDPDAPAESLSAGLKQRLEILKALAADTTILLLDEPTGVLAPPEVDELSRSIRAFAAAGGSAVLITHKLEEALRLADRVTVLRRGRVVLAGAVAGQTTESLARAMIGEAAEAVEMTAPRRAVGGGGAPVVRCTGLDVPREHGHGLAVRGAALEVAAGEVLGLAAIEGNGQRQLLRAVAGLIQATAGALEVAQPVAFVPEDRTREGLIPELSLTENVVLGLGRDAPWVRGARIDWAAARAHTAALIQRFAIRARDTEAPAGTLSGGNQQKLVLSRALARAPRVLVAENPTRGLDVQATRALWRQLRAATESGTAVLVWSSDLDELLARCDRLVVVTAGVVRPVPAGADRAVVGALMLGTEGGR